MKLGALFLPLSTILIFHMGCSEQLPSKRVSREHRIYDFANRIKYKNSMEAHLATLYKRADIDMVVVTVKNLAGESIDTVTARLFTEWKIGENTNGLKGVLFFLSEKEQLVRFEVGYDLEWIYTDAFTGYIERDQMAPFFKLGRVEDGISATLEMIIARANEKIEEQKYDPAEKKTTKGDTYYSGGAGATQRIEIGSIKIPEKTNYPADIKALFVPQPTPAEAYLLDIEKCKRHIRGYDFDLYTNETREISKNWVFTKAQMDNEVRDTAGKSFRIFIKENRAIAVFEPKFRNCPPCYLKKCRRGWQLDIATMSKTIHFDMRNRAHIGLYQNPYKDLFKENGYTFGVNGFLYYKGEEPAYLGISSWDGGTRAAKILTLVKDGPGEKAGLQVNDTIIKVGDIDVKGTHEIVMAENRYKIGETVLVKVKRGIRTKKIKVTLEAYDPYRE
ncbi:MAG: TPM domain-containing protein [bacterium]